MTYHIGQVVQGVVTGIQPYGAFVKIDEENTGLIHISEISDGFVNDVRYFVRIGEKVIVKIIDIDAHNHQLRLSLKAIMASRRARYSEKRVNTIPKEIGFKTLEAKLSEWIKNTEENYD